MTCLTPTQSRDPSRDALGYHRDERTVLSTRHVWRLIDGGEPCSEDYIRWLVWAWPDLTPVKYRKRYKSLWRKRYRLLMASGVPVFRPTYLGY